MARYNDDPKRPEMSGREYKSVVLAMMATSEMRRMIKDICKERQDLIPRFGRRVKTCATQMGKIIDQIVATMPGKNLSRLQKELPYLVHEVKTQAVASAPAEWCFVRNTDINELFKVVIEDKCQLCDVALGATDEDQKAVAACPLRRAMMSIQAPYDLDTYGCPYGNLTFVSKREMDEAVKEYEEKEK